MDFTNIHIRIILVTLIICICVYSESVAYQNEIKDLDTTKWLNRPDSSIENSSGESEEVRRQQQIKISSQPRPSNIFKDNIEFRERESKLQNQKVPVTPNVFYTKGQTRDHVQILYPTVNTNPNNRLQLDPEDAITLSAAIATTTPKYEDFNFFATEKRKFSPNIGNISKSHNEMFIRTLDVTMDIVRHSFWEDENVVFSPLSICNVLALLMLGADGRTYDEISRVLRLNLANETRDVERDLKFHQTFQRLRGYLNQKSGKDISVELANQVFTNKKFYLENSYLNESQKYYGAPAKSFDFGKDGKKFKDEVNKWVQEKTKGKISTIVERIPSEDTTLALVNAIYFKGGWETPFTEKITRRMPFYVNSNETVQVQMMTNVLSVPYFEDDDLQMIAIPYKGNKTGFFVILPKSSHGIEGLKFLEKRLSEFQRTEMASKLNKMQVQKVAVKIPKMKITTDGHMTEILKNIGIPSMFQPDLANFSRISHDDGLFVSTVLHRAVMEVSERGTEAAAVTLATGDRIIEDPPIPFVANRPFMFFISHIHAKAILFWGRVTRPEWT